MTLTENQIQKFTEKAMEVSGAKNQTEMLHWLLEQHATRRHWMPTQKENKARAKKKKKSEKNTVKASKPSSKPKQEAGL